MTTSLARRVALPISAAVLVMGSLAACSGDSAPEVASVTSPTAGSSSQAGASDTASGNGSTTTTSSSSTAESAQSPSSSSIPGTRSDLVRVCGDGQADQTRKACKTNEPSVNGSTIYCSADLPSDVRGNVSAVLYRNGSEVFKGNINRTSTTGSLMLNYSVGKLDMAGGNYTCQFKAGSQTWTKDTEVNGPTGRANQGMACDGSKMFTTGTVTHCTSNSTTLSNPASLGCSALATDLQGRKVSATLTTPDGPKNLTLSENFNLGSAVVYLRAPKTAFPGATFPKGSYTCTFLVDDQQVISIPFSVG